MSKKINNYILHDFETGGLSCLENPATEWGCAVVRGTNYEQIMSYHNVIKPYDDKLVYTEGATKLHGLSKEVCARDGIHLSQMMEDMLTVFVEANTENSKIGMPTLVGHNVCFDNAFLEDLAIRCKVDLSKYLNGWRDGRGVWHPHYIDTLQLVKNVLGFSTDKTVKFNLLECCRHFGIEVVDGHRAMNDVLPTKELFVALMTRLRSSGGSMAGQETGIKRYRDTFAI